MEALEHCHESGVTHRDLKPENLMITSDCKLKIIDFGFAGPIAGRDGAGKLSTRRGTRAYMAPEILAGETYRGANVDIFSSGIILFIMLKGSPPFKEAKGSDAFYKCLIDNNAKTLWEAHEAHWPENACAPSEDFKLLVTAML